MLRGQDNLGHPFMPALLISCSLLGLSLRPSWGADLRKVTTSVRISAEIFHDNFPTKIEDIENSAASEIGSSIADPQKGLAQAFRYLRWIPRDEDSQMSSPSAKLVLEVYQQNRIGPRVLLCYRTNDEGGETADIFPPDPVLYEGYELDFPRRNPRKLLEDLVERIRKHISQDAFRSQLEARFLSRIVLSESLDIDQDARRLSIPHLDAMQVTENSRLRVDLTFEEQGLEKDGRMVLSPTFHSAGIQRCQIHNFYLGADILIPGENDPDNVFLWHDALMFVSESSPRFWVYMLNYDKRVTSSSADF